jgi:hypothetical protein
MSKIVILVAFLVIAANFGIYQVSAPAFTNVNVTNNSSNQNSPMVAINPLNHQKLVCGYNDLRSGVWKLGWSWSDDGGSTWTYGGTFNPLSGYNRCADPNVAFDNTGTAYFAGTDYNYDSVSGRGKDGSVFLAKSNDGGHTFTVFRKIIITGSGYNPDLDFTKMYINQANNNIYLAWTRRMNAWGVTGTEATTIWFTRSTNGGTTFSSPIQVSTFSPATGSSRSHGVQIAAVGSKVYVSWHTVEAGTLGQPSWVPPKIYIAASTDGGVTFGTNYLVAVKQNSLPNRFISMGTDPSSGKIYIVYADRPTYPGDYDAYVATSTAAAGPWTIKRVNDDPVGNGFWQFWPSLGVAPNGRVDVIWYDERDADNLYGVYYSASNDGGSTWQTNIKLTNAVFPWPDTSLYWDGDFITVASVNEKAQATWGDYRYGSGNLEVYTVGIPITTKTDTKIDFTFQPNPAKPGQTVTLSGTLKDVNNIPVYPASVTVEYSINGGASWNFIWTLPTNTAGQFSQSFSAPAIGEYLVRVSYAGSTNYNPSSQTVKLVVQTGVSWTYNFRMSPASDVLRFNLVGSVIHGVAENSVGPYPYANAPVIGYVDAGSFYLFIDGPDKTAPFWELVMMVGSVSTLSGNVYQTMDGTSWNGPTAYTLVPVAPAKSYTSDQALASLLTVEPESWPATYHFRLNPFVDVVHLSVDGQLIHGLCDATTYHNQPVLGWTSGGKFYIATDFTKNDDGSEILYELSMNVGSVSTLAGNLYRTVDGKSVVGPTAITLTTVPP